MLKDPKIVIVMTAYNVAHVLKQTIAELPSQYTKNIILVDDASTDGTVQMAVELGLMIVRHPKNRGYGAAQKTGYKTAIAEGADIAILVHGDNQYDPSLVPVFVKKIRDEGFDVVTGTRMVLGDVIKKGMPLWKFIPNRFLTWLENTTFETNISDYHNGYRAYSTEFLKKVPLDLLSDKFDFDTDIMIQAAIRKQKIAEIPHPTRYAKENSQMPFKKAVWYGLSILKTVGSYSLHKSGVHRRKIFSA